MVSALTTQLSFILSIDTSCYECALKEASSHKTTSTIKELEQDRFYQVVFVKTLKEEEDMEDSSFDEEEDSEEEEEEKEKRASPLKRQSSSRKRTFHGLSISECKRRARAYNYRLRKGQAAKGGGEGPDLSLRRVPQGVFRNGQSKNAHPYPRIQIGPNLFRLESVRLGAQ